MGAAHQLVTVKQALEKLAMDWDDLWEQAQAVEAKLLFPLPSGAELQAQDEAIKAESKTVQSVFAKRKQRFRTTLPLMGMDYFVPASANLVEIGKMPEVACDYVTHVAFRLPSQAVVSIFSIAEVVKDTPLMSLYDKTICMLAPLGLWLPANTNVALDVERACLLEEDVERIRSRNFPNYPPGIEDIGTFQPTEHTTRMIREMNTAYHLFRVKYPVDPKDPKAKVKVKDWFDSTWNSEERAKGQDAIGGDVLTKAVEVILNNNRSITIGTLKVRDEIKDQHAVGAPDALMLMEQLAQKRAVWTRPEKRTTGDIDFDTRSVMEQDLKEAQVGPERYLRLIRRVLDPSR